MTFDLVKHMAGGKLLLSHGRSNRVTSRYYHRQEKELESDGNEVP